MSSPKLPDAPPSIQKGVPLKLLLDKDAVTQLAENLHLAYDKFKKQEFVKDTLSTIEPLTLTERSTHIADKMHEFLPGPYSQNIEIILASLTPPLERTHDNGTAPMFYMPHASYIGKYGVNADFNKGNDPFDLSMNAQYELTKRFTCEFSIRFFIIDDQKRTFDQLYKWMNDSDPHVRRLTTEGPRPRLPWAPKLTSLANDPSPSLPILEYLKTDSDLYVRRSVANHVGDIAKDHPDLAFDLCEKWLDGASDELKWVIRHAVRNPFKKGVKRAIDLRKAAK